MNSDLLKRVSDELSIREVLARYCRAIDRCDLTLLKSVYWPEATDDHVVFVGNAIEFSDFVVPLLKEQTECTMHSISNIWIQLDGNGNTACTETYVTAYHRMRTDGPKEEVIVGGRYLDRFEQRNGEWRIAERKFVTDWEQNGAPLLGGEDNVRAMFQRDTRCQDEDSYRLFANKTII